MGRISAEAEFEQYCELLVWAFGGTLEKARKWTAALGADARVARRDGRVVAGLGELPMGQWFGGKSLPMLGVAGVTVAPEARERGFARELLTDMLRDARARDFSLSMLYPSTYSLYRALGYEQAGNHYRISVRVEDMPRPQKTALELTRVSPADLEELEATYRAVARQRSGYLDRGAAIWQRKREPDFEPATGFVARSQHGIEGYVYVKQENTAEPGVGLTLTDVVTRTPAARDAILRFLANHRTTANKVVFRDSSANAFALGFTEPVLEVGLRTPWMLRFVDVGKALLGRGYPQRSAEVDLQVDDPILPENSGRYRLRVRDGVAELDYSRQAGGARITVGGLAALYSGHLSAEELVSAGLLEADAATVERLSVLFAGPAPACPDYF